MKQLRTVGGLLAVALSVSLGLSGCGSGSGSADESDVALAWSVDVAWPQFGVADKLGLFEDEGLNAKLVRFDSGANGFKAMLAGGADFAVVAEFPVTLSALGGSEPRILATVTRFDNSRIVAGPGTGIKKVEDLRGKKVGTHSGTSVEFFLSQMLAKHGMTMGDIKKVDVPPPNAASLFLDGQVDALASWEPNATKAEEGVAGKGGAVLADPSVYEVHYSLVTTQRVLDEKPEVAEKMLRVMIEATERMNQDPSVALDVLVKETGGDRGLFEKLMGAHHYQVGLDESLVRTMTDQQKWATESDVVPSSRSIDVTDFIDPAPLRKVDPDLVELG